jgi:hypothetical protein
MWNWTDGEPDEELEAEPNEGAAAGSESEEDTGSASAWASSESSNERLMKSSSVWWTGRADTVAEARVGRVIRVKNSSKI